MTPQWYVGRHTLDDRPSGTTPEPDQRTARQIVVAFVAFQLFGAVAAAAMLRDPWPVAPIAVLGGLISGVLFDTAMLRPWARAYGERIWLLMFFPWAARRTPARVEWALHDAYRPSRIRATARATGWPVRHVYAVCALSLIAALTAVGFLFAGVGLEASPE
ncbi:MAG TPA: hypothetical protein VNA12_09675 [Mycobacteriales bacterium]|nr:hypothetical protein [Mycobacteriales bacterium]